MSFVTDYVCFLPYIISAFAIFRHCRLRWIMPGCVLLALLILVSEYLVPSTGAKGAFLGMVLVQAILMFSMSVAFALFNMAEGRHWETQPWEEDFSEEDFLENSGKK